MPSTKILEMKKEVVNEIKDRLNKSKSVVLFDYRGLTDADVKDLRIKLKESGSDYKVYKNTLLKLAFNDLNVSMDDYLEGPTAIVFSSDDIAAVKILSDVAKKNEALELKAGIIEGNVQDKAKLEELGKHIAMHIAATAPIALNIAGVAPEAVEHEKSIFAEQAKASGKPANIIEKMVEGRIRKFYEEVVLEEQAFIMDPDKKIKDIVADAAKECGTDIKLTDFVFFKLGDGLQKKEEDFAAEVAAQLGK